jgi:hypothetical protein
MTSSLPRRFRIDWVLVDALAVGVAPREERHLRRLEEQQISAVFSLCSEEEAPPPSGLRERFHCERLVLPDHRSRAVLQLHQLQSALAQLERLLEKGRVYVHCVAAMERSPLVCMAWMVQQRGLTPAEALEYVMTVHPGTNPLPRDFALLNQLSG